MKLLETFIKISHEITDIFHQQRSSLRAQRLLLSNLLCIGRHWITRLLCATNRDQLDWSADYKLFSRSHWKSQDLFMPVIRRSLGYFQEDEPICLAGDETKIKRGGRKLKHSRWMRDPLSPPFHVNFIKGIRILQFSVLLPLYRMVEGSARSVPILFEPLFTPDKPRRKASREEKAAYAKACKDNSMCRQALERLRQLRRAFDLAGAANRLLLFFLDGGFCNRIIFKTTFDRIFLIARCRADAKLCFSAQDPAHPRKKFADKKFTPEQIRQDTSRSWRKGMFFIGGKKRKIRYKEVKNVLWQRGAGTKRLRLIVIAPTPYHLSLHSRTYYRQPAYLLTDALYLAVELLIQNYINRWEIEVNHRDEKQHLGVGDPQVWNEASVDRLPAFLVASYSCLLLASLQAYGVKRTQDYIQPPKWQRRRTRPSCLDLLSQLRLEAFAHSELLKPLGICYKSSQAAIKAA